MTRIRYKRQEDGTLTSGQFLAVGELVTVSLFSDTYSGIVLNGKGFKIKEFKATNMQNLKKIAKKTLLDMSVNFSPEVRPRLTTELIKDDLGPNVSLTYKQDLFEE